MTAMHIVETPHQCEARVDDIVVGERHRTDLGDIASLQASIESVGLIQPVVVTVDNHLVAGARRLTACKRLGWDVVPVTIIRTLADATDLLVAERDENTCRKDFTASELVSIGRALEQLERPKADERRREGNRRGGEIKNHGRASGEGQPEKLRTDKAVGEALGISQSTYQRLKYIEKATRDADPEIAEFAEREFEKLNTGATSAAVAASAVVAKRKAPEPRASVISISPTPVPRKRSPITDAFTAVAFNLTKDAERLTRLSEDDRFTTHREKLQLKASDLIRSRDAIQAVINKLTPQD